MKWVHLFTVSMLCGITCYSQSYKKDSLQIKSYTTVKYVDNRAVKIETTKVFCDYCTDYQKKMIGIEAERRAYLLRNDPKNKMENGEKKLAIYIRIAKKDFAAIKEEN